MIRACAKRFTSTYPGWSLDPDRGDGCVDLVYNHESEHAPVIDGEKSNIEILLVIDSSEMQIRSWATAKTINDCEELIPTIPLLKEIIPFIDKALKTLCEYIPSDYKEKTFSPISFQDSDSFYFKYVTQIINEQNEFGDTELIKLVKNATYDMDKEIIHDAIIKSINIGADIDICNNDGESARGLLIKYKQDSILAYIEKIELEKEINEDEIAGLGL